MKNNILKHIVLFLIGGALYCVFELIFRSRTHWTMFIVGGICFVFCGLINEVIPKDTVIWWQAAIGAVGITFIEFVSGVIINLILGWNVWDYSNLPFNILGQISLVFSALWYILALFAIVLDDWLRHWLFGEEKPHYRFK